MDGVECRAARRLSSGNRRRQKKKSTKVANECFGSVAHFTSIFFFKKNISRKVTRDSQQGLYLPVIILFRYNDTLITLADWILVGIGEKNCKYLFTIDESELFCLRHSFLSAAHHRNNDGRKRSDYVKRHKYKSRDVRKSNYIQRSVKSVNM